MAFYTGNLFPKWKGSLFIGALGGAMLVRLTLDGDKVTVEERLMPDLGERIATCARARMARSGC